MVAGITTSEKEFNVGGHVFRIRPLPVLEMLAHIESVVKRGYADSVSRAAASIPQAERNAFIFSGLSTLPSGEVLSKLVEDHLRTINGMLDIVHMAIAKFDNMPIEDIQEIFSKNIDTLKEVTAFITGDGNAPFPVSPTSK